MNNKSEAFFDQNEKNPIKEYKFEPSESLKLHIKEFMVVECLNSIAIETLPSASVSLNYLIRGGIKLKLANKNVINLPKAFAFGIARKTLNFEFSNRTILFVVIFNPGMASSLINTPINEFFEKFIPFEDFFSHEQISFLEEQFAKQENYIELIKVIEKFLLLEIEWAHVDGIIKESIRKISNAQGNISIKNLVSEFPLSRDAFEKKFRKQVGTSPKQFSNIVRSRYLFGNGMEEPSLTKIGLSAGYYDQSHFIKDFKAITGKKPSDFK